MNERKALCCMALCLSILLQEGKPHHIQGCKLRTLMLISNLMHSPCMCREASGCLNVMSAAQGTPGLMYGPAVDLWSAGVVLFILLGGYPPFYDESEPALFSQIRRGHFSFDDPVWDSVSARSAPL